MLLSCDNRALIEPRRRKGESLLPSRALIIIVPEDLEEFVSLLNCRRSRSLFLSNVYQPENHEEFCIVGPLLGAPQAAMVIEKLVVLGVREIVALGWAGSLQDYVKIGDVVVPTGAYSEEGTTAHYLPSDSLPRMILPCQAPIGISTLVDKLVLSGLNVHKGFVWTTDAPYRETVGKVLFYQNRGVLAVDMETSALFGVARFRGVSLGVLLMVSDNLSRLKWKPGMKSDEFSRTRKILLKSLSDFIEEQISVEQ